MRKKDKKKPAVYRFTGRTIHKMIVTERKKDVDKGSRKKVTPLMVRPLKH